MWSLIFKREYPSSTYWFFSATDLLLHAFISHSEDISVLMFVFLLVYTMLISVWNEWVLHTFRQFSIVMADHFRSSKETWQLVQMNIMPHPRYYLTQTKLSPMFSQNHFPFNQLIVPLDFLLPQSSLPKSLLKFKKMEKVTATFNALYVFL